MKPSNEAKAILFVYGLRYSYACDACVAAHSHLLILDSSLLLRPCLVFGYSMHLLLFLRLAIFILFLNN